MICLATHRDYPVLVDIWEQSIRTTHHFLPEDYLQRIKSLLPTILPHVKIYVWRDENTIKGFAGVSVHKMEMLFIHPAYFHQKLGSQLTKFCIYSLNVDEVDVNEQNVTAIHFYKRMGYQLIGRDEVDNQGRPFPILHLKHKRNEHSSRHLKHIGHIGHT